MKINIGQMQIENLDYRQLKPLQGNLKSLSDTNYKKLKKSFKEKGLFVPMFVWRHDDEMWLMDGHGRERLFEREKAIFVDAKGNETYKVPCLVIDAKHLKDAKEKLLLITSQFQTMTQEGLDEFAFDLDDSWLKDTTAFDAISFPAPEDDEQDAVDENDIPELSTKVITKRGDLWIMGDHRLLCDDCTATNSWGKLFGADKASLVFTDPPYGVSYDAQSDKFAKIKNDSLTGDKLAQFLVKVFVYAIKKSATQAAFYIWHASSTRNEFAEAMVAAGLEERQYLIWAKNSLVLGHSDYQWSHEPCFYACKSGQSPAFYGDRAQQTVWRVTCGSAKEGLQTTVGQGLVLTDGKSSELFVKERAPRGKKARRIRVDKGLVLRTGSDQGTLWEVDRETGAEHPTQKPVELARRAIQNSSQPGEIVTDPFLGSGTTLIGAELTGRRCFGFELEPQYCDVIVKRWEKITGKSAVKESANGKAA